MHFIDSWDHCATFRRPAGSTGGSPEDSLNIVEYFNVLACVAKVAFFADRRLWREVAPKANGKPAVFVANSSYLELEFWKSLPSLSHPGEQMSIQEFREDYGNDHYKLCAGMIKLHVGAVAEISGRWTKERPVQQRPIPTCSQAYHLQFAETDKQRELYRVLRHPGSCFSGKTKNHGPPRVDETTWSNTFQRVTSHANGKVIQARSATVITLPELLQLTAKNGISLHVVYSWWLAAPKIIKHKIHSHGRTPQSKVAQEPNQN